MKFRIKGKTCKDCFWIHPIPFFEDWHGCLLPKKDKRGHKTRKSTKSNKTACDYFKEN